LLSTSEGIEKIVKKFYFSMQALEQQDLRMPPSVEIMIERQYATTCLTAVDSIIFSS
jgi:hypothetical protein